VKTLSKYVTFSITVLLIYTVVEFLLSSKTGVTHDTLTTCVFAFFGTEIGSCCLIQITKRRTKADNTTEDTSEEWDDLEVNEEDAKG
jgi:hypothetical protein